MNPQLNDFSLLFGNKKSRIDPTFPLLKSYCPLLLKELLPPISHQPN